MLAAERFTLKVAFVFPESPSVTVAFPIDIVGTGTGVAEQVFKIMEIIPSKSVTAISGCPSELKSPVVSERVAVM